MGTRSCFSLWQVMCTAILLADCRSFFTIDTVRGMRSSHADIKYLEKQSNFQHLEGTFVRDDNKGRKLRVSSGEESSSREVVGLIQFKDSLTSDHLGALQSWNANDSDACSWTGIKCSKLSNNVAALDLRNLGLVGIMPQMIGFLTSLEYLDLSNNNLSGSIPYSIANCSNLSYLNVSNNQVTGEIPSDVGKLSHLQTLDVTQNNLTGLIPEAIGNCSVLEILNLGSNVLEGAIPLMVGQLSRLTQLALQYNIISGSIPGTLGNCSHLASLILFRNYHLGGELPEELSQLRKMQVFNVNSCNFVGVFPTWVTNFTSLIDFKLVGNQFSGEIPEEIGKLSKNLTELILWANQFTGPIPAAIGNCSGLAWLDISQNQMTGDIPGNIGFLSNLQTLSLDHNNFSGVLPPSLSNCSALLWLQVGANPMNHQIVPSWIASLASLDTLYMPKMNLYGEIPESLGQLSNLEYLTMSGNYLGGVIPTFLGNLSLLEKLDLSTNQLQGEIPPEITGNLTSLFFLGLSQNNFVGSLPKFSNLIELWLLEVSYNFLTGIDFTLGQGAPSLAYFLANNNNFTGHLPDGIGNFSSLQTLILEYNGFTGSIPPLWGNLTNLGYLDVLYNKLEGMIPETLMSCTQLVTLLLGNNEFKGSIPHEIGQLVNLQQIELNSNFFFGILPSSFANLTNIGEIKLGDNRFSGPISGNTLLRMAASLYWLDISHNSISGALPPELHRLTNLQYLDVSGNNISGSLLPGLAACIELAYLDVSLNSLTGTLPADLGLLQSLQFFNASYNNFAGPIPTSGLFLTHNITKSSFLDNPELCGSTGLVSHQCSNLNVLAHHPCKSLNCRGIWIPVVVSVSALLLVGTVMMYWCFLAGHERRGQDMAMDFTLGGTVILSDLDLTAIIEGGEDNVIGLGANSIVYKGVLPGGEICALKVLRNEDIDNNGEMKKPEELLKEVQTLAQLQHVNIIKVLGFSMTPDVKALALEYMPRGNLHDILHSDGEVCKLSHQERFKIILGIAESLVYLHHSLHDPVIHRDLKPSNILLGMDLQPKLGDFGISKFARFQAGEPEASASTFCGTFGYMPPEYAFQSSVSAKGDVYSFGVVLLELLTGRKPASTTSSMVNGDLVEFVLGSFKEKPFDLLDYTLMEEGRADPTSKDQLMLLLRVGVLCTRPTPKSRPNMNDVLGMLKQIKDVGSEIRPLKTVEELAKKLSVWDPNAEQQLGDQVTSFSSY